jgi:SdrD B-like domain
MKKIILLLICGLLLPALAVTSKAATVSGFVLCDANQNGTNDIGDVGIPNVMVVVTNENGSFSNSTVTAGNGFFSLQIPNFDPLAERQDPLSQVYIETLNPATLPAGSTIDFPMAITNLIATPAFFIDFAADLTNLVYTSASGTATNGNWLINNPDCQVQTTTTNCMLNGGGVIRSRTRNRPDHTFAGNIFSRISPRMIEGGNWVDVAHNLNLMFQSTTIESVRCGELAITPSNRRMPKASFIEFSGTGTLKGIGGNRLASIPVLFTARVEDRGQPGMGVDRYYLRVFTADGTTLLLVSGDPSNPANIVPVPISSGNLSIQMR